MLLTSAAEAENSCASPQEHSEGSEDQVAGRNGAAYGENLCISFESTHTADETRKSERDSIFASAPQSSTVLTGDGTCSRARDGERPNDYKKNVFLTAYHERSARRSLRPLLRQWGMEARVLQDAPRRVLPKDLWEDGRFGSIALIEITLRR